jgi:hypothetical protein
LNAKGKPSISYAVAGECNLRLDKTTAQAPPGDQKVYLPIVTQTERVFVDPLDHPGGGWPSVSSEEADTYYEDGVYKINVKKSNYDWLSTPAIPAKDLRIEVSAAVTKGEAQTYGLFFNYAGHLRALEFSVRGNQYSLRRVYPYSGEEAIVPWTVSPYINPAPAWNRLRLIRQGTQVELYINDHYLASATIDDDGMASSDLVFGLAAHTSQGSINVQFDNFRFASLNDHLNEYGDFPLGYFYALPLSLP